ncbi:DUF4148 domain-containing protein [Paraburkholderia strydomiana]|uniref:DUF4148 domain-containing protein n=1 Tax=Paraburkholderia strydomiana TaxID=1245417 RepID=UPI0038BE14BC
MKSLIHAVVVAAALAAPVVSFAQSNVTRAQVRAELIQLQSAGYHVGDGDNATYPEAIQAAEAKVAAQNGATSGYGGEVKGSSESGHPSVTNADWNAMYNHP